MQYIHIKYTSAVQSIQLTITRGIVTDIQSITIKTAAQEATNCVGTNLFTCACIGGTLINIYIHNIEVEYKL